MRCLVVLTLVALPALAQDRPPQEAGPFRAADLVELIAIEPTLRLDIRYATANNFVGRPVYDEARAFLQREVAEDLKRAHQALRQHGYGLLIFDGYRPWTVTRLFWEVTPPDKRAYVADPRKGSLHNRGCAVDLSLFDLKTGREVAMPSAYDEATERAHPAYKGGTAEQRARRDLLIGTLARFSFSVQSNEWWHFNHKSCKSYPILDIAFRDIRKK
jgi:D-alanyl-D-alanine dipeptidase